LFTAETAVPFYAESQGTEETSMMSSHNPKTDQPTPDLRTRPMRTQRRLGVWVWVAIAVVFIIFVIVSIATRSVFI
jgi:hypothetical protein